MTTVSSSSIAAILVAFAAYLLFMIVIGAICMRRTKSSEDNSLGGRSLTHGMMLPPVRASPHMSGWSSNWAAGLHLCVRDRRKGGLHCHRVIFRNRSLTRGFPPTSKRLRRYTIVAGNSMTLPEFLENRFHDKKESAAFHLNSVVIILLSIYSVSPCLGW